MQFNLLLDRSWGRLLPVTHVIAKMVGFIHKRSMSEKSLNLVIIKKGHLPVEVMRDISQRLAFMGGVEIGNETNLVPGDFDKLTLWLYQTGDGKGHEAIFVIPLSVFQSQSQRLQALLKPLLLAHLRAELEQLEVPIPDDFANL